jgi:hypothetical protein
MSIDALVRAAEAAGFAAVAEDEFEVARRSDVAPDIPAGRSVGPHAASTTLALPAPAAGGFYTTQAHLAGQAMVRQVTTWLSRGAPA